MGEVAPPWFSAFTAKFDLFQANLTTRVGHLETFIETATENKARIIEHDRRFDVVEEQLSKQTDPAFRDRGEFTIGGIPAQVKLSPREIVESLLEGLNLLALTDEISDAREMRKNGTQNT